jgi:hypothetical protein
MERLAEMKVSAFNPQVDDWEPWMVEMENRCIRESPMVIFPVLGSTLGLGSLGEIGFSVMSVLRSIAAGQNRELIVLIDQVCDDGITVSVRDEDGVKRDMAAAPDLIQESNRMRALVRSKLEAEIWRQGVHLVDSLEEASTIMERLLNCGHLLQSRAVG